MGQYYYVANPVKKEFLDPAQLGSGMKIWEILANHPGVGEALVILLANHPEPRGGGDLNMDYPEAREVIGRWAGDPVFVVGDYAEPNDCFDYNMASLYDACQSGRYRDITPLVAKVLERELMGRYLPMFPNDPKLKRLRTWKAVDVGQQGGI